MKRISSKHLTAFAALAGEHGFAVRCSRVSEPDSCGRWASAVCIDLVDRDGEDTLSVVGPTIGRALRKFCANPDRMMYVDIYTVTYVNRIYELTEEYVRWLERSV